MLHQRLAVDTHTLLAGAADGFVRLFGTDMHHVERHAGHVGNHDGAVGGFALDFGGPGIGMGFGTGIALREELGRHGRDHVAVLGVDQW